MKKYISWLPLFLGVFFFLLFSLPYVLMQTHFHWTIERSASELVCVGMHDNYCVPKCFSYGEAVIPHIVQNLEQCPLRAATAGRTAYVLGTFDTPESVAILEEMYLNPERFPGNAMYTKTTGLLGLSFSRTATLPTDTTSFVTDLRKEILEKSDGDFLLYEMLLLAASRIESCDFEKVFLPDFKNVFDERGSVSSDIDISAPALVEQFALREKKEVVTLFENLLKDRIDSKRARVLFDDAEINRFLRAALYVNSVSTFKALASIAPQLETKADKDAFVEIMQCLTAHKFNSFQETLSWIDTHPVWQLTEERRELLKSEIRNEKRYWFANGLNGYRPYMESCTTFSGFRKELGLTAQ